MSAPISIAIETSCRLGGLALGRGEDLIDVVRFDAAGRHATQLISHLRDLLAGANLTAQDLDEVYVSAGPGSFTGLRVGITAVRTLAQALPKLRCVAVPTARAIAEGDTARRLDWTHLGVILDARKGTIHATQFQRDGEDAIETAAGRVVTPADFLAEAPRPLLLIGEGLTHEPVEGRGVVQVPPEPHEAHLPTPEATWRVGRKLAWKQQFTEYHHLLPIYARDPEAVRLWEARNPSA
jgi:tRNA threonylcarbamoyladenosine biosynthesis protein TsaB